VTRILFLTDLHGASGYLPALLAEQRAADVVLLGGDVTSFGGEREVASMVEPLMQTYPRVYGVQGNVDFDGVLTWLEERDLSLHGRGRVFRDIGLHGCGGSNHTPLKTPTEYTETEIGALLEEGHAHVRDARVRVVVSHTPPLDTPADRMFTGKHVGSSAVRAFVERTTPALCLCGHIHEAASVHRMGDSWVVNPGSFSTGRYAVVDVGDDGVVGARLCRVRVGRLTRTRVTTLALAAKLGGFIKHRLSR
jgi:Icc-related predicted phosphoesterase